MIEIIQKKGSNVSPVSISEFRLNSQLTWINCSAPDDDDFSWLHKTFRIPRSELQECISAKENPRIEHKEDYTQILFKAAYMKTVAQTTLVGVFLIKKTIILIHKLEPESVPSSETVSKSFMSKDHEFLLFNIMASQVQNFDLILDKIEDQIDLLEEKILNEVKVDYNHQSYLHKKSLIFLRKALKNNAEVAKGIRRDHYKIFRDPSLFDDLLYDINRLMDLEEISRDRLSEILNIYISNTSKKTNEIMKGLTILASVFAFPMLISGIYGMNFRYDAIESPFNMPELFWRYGYIFSLGLMLFSIVIALIYIKHKKYI
jgi:magnesium transporter